MEEEDCYDEDRGWGAQLNADSDDDDACDEDAEADDVDAK